MSQKRRPWWRKHVKVLILSTISVFLIVVGMGAIWFATLQTPDLSAFQSRKVAQSTKIYDRTGEILLYDVHNDTRRTIVPFEAISQDIKNATISIEDTNFYKHIGIEPTAILRAVLSNILGNGSTQGGSTITQQVIKNSILTQDKTLTRKLKEWILAVKIEKVLTKDQILDTYLNESPYGGNIYGVEEASKTFFGKSAKDLTLAEAAYIAAIPQAPTFYSPYGQNKERLTARQRLVLSKMKENGYITDDEYKGALAEEVTFLEKNTTGIRAPHFSMYVRAYLIQKYGEDVVDEGGLKVTTTLDYDMQSKAEKVVRNFAPNLEKQFNASNTAMVAINPKNGDILTMVGSRDYFDTKIDGNFNVATAYRQPGSTFKPFVYSTLFEKGYTPETILYDAKIEFSTECTVEGYPKPGVDPKKCYTPVEYDDLYEGPITIRQALAHSRNIPAVQAIYLAGVKDSLKTARDMGITSLGNPDQYGLTLVLGGGEVSLLELTSAYGVFANDGVRNPYRSILKVEDSSGNILEEAKEDPTQALPAEQARQISDILSDTKVRMASLIPVGEAVGGKQIAIKTGTTNDFRDVWIVGYTPSVVVGAWAGKNDNSPMEKKVAGLIISPLWAAFMSEINSTLPREYFKKPAPAAPDLKPVMRGIWKGGVSYKIDSVTRKMATEFTPPELQEEVVLNSVHSILYWVNKSNPLGPAPTNPSSDSQYDYWEYGVRSWFNNWKLSNPGFIEEGGAPVGSTTDDVHIPSNFPVVSITAPAPDSIVKSLSKVNISLNVTGTYPLKKSELYVNDRYIYTSELDPRNLGFVPKDVGVLQGRNTIKVVVYDTVLNQGQSTINLNIQD